MELNPLYQTIKKQGDKQSVARFGPIYGRKDTWLGDGYYFWDGFIKLAHWWGKKHCAGSYVICRASVVVEDHKVLDLVGRTADLKNFEVIYNAIKEKNPFQQITVPAVLAEMRKRTSFPYLVIRARSEHRIPENENIRFVDKDRAEMVLIPAIQLCVRERNLVRSYEEVWRTSEEGVV